MSHRRMILSALEYHHSGQLKFANLTADRKIAGLCPTFDSDALPYVTDVSAKLLNVGLSEENLRQDPVDKVNLVHHAERVSL